jgi:hypothetical protein
MRRYVQILGLVVLALSAGGWGAVVAAVLCPHANSGLFKPGAAQNMAADYACHPVKVEKRQKPHCHEDETAEQEEGATIDDASSNAMPGNRGSMALDLPQNVPCTHCLSRPEVPASTIIARQQSEQRRSLEPAVPPSATPAIPARSFAGTVAYRQGAPPGSHTPKHLLIGILLI